MLAILDASQRNAYERRFRTYSHGLAPVAAPDNSLIISSNTPGKVADDTNGERSVLVTELLNELNAAVSTEGIFHKIHVAVFRAFNGAQMPSVSSSLSEDVHFSHSSDVDLTTSSLAPTPPRNAPLVAQKMPRLRSHVHLLAPIPVCCDSQAGAAVSVSALARSPTAPLTVHDQSMQAASGGLLLRP